MKKSSVVKHIFNGMPLAVRVSLIGMWVPIVNQFTFIPQPVRAVLVLVLLGCQWALVRKPFKEMEQKFKMTQDSK